MGASSETRKHTQPTRTFQNTTRTFQNWKAVLLAPRRSCLLHCFFPPPSVCDVPFSTYGPLIFQPTSQPPLSLNPSKYGPHNVLHFLRRYSRWPGFYRNLHILSPPISPILPRWCPSDSSRSIDRQPDSSHPVASQHDQTHANCDEEETQRPSCQ